MLYVPTGPSDPRYDFTTNLGDGFDQGDVDDFFAFLASSGLNAYAGAVTPKNTFTGPWYSDLDIRISQEIGVWREHELQVYLDIENALNLFSDSNNVRTYNNVGDIPEGIRVLQLDEDNTSVFEVEDIFFEDIPQVDVNDSVYRIQFGIRYRF